MTNALFDVFQHTIQDIYNSEKQITVALPKMIDAARNADLREALSDHLSETQNQVRRIEQVCQILGFRTGDVTCQGTAGLVREAQEQMEKFCPGPGCDAAIIANCQKVEHYEICGYGTVIEWAKKMDIDGDAIDLLEETLKEESSANEKLNKIATKQVNEDAMKAQAMGVGTSRVEVI